MTPDVSRDRLLGRRTEASPQDQSEILILLPLLRQLQQRLLPRLRLQQLSNQLIYLLLFRSRRRGIPIGHQQFGGRSRRRERTAGIVGCRWVIDVLRERVEE